jgi:hypothetical protein
MKMQRSLERALRHSVLTIDGLRWNVSPTFLRKGESKNITLIKDNIIQIKKP